MTVLCSNTTCSDMLGMTENLILFEDYVYALNHPMQKYTDDDNSQLWFYFIKHNKESF